MAADVKRIAEHHLGTSWERFAELATHAREGDPLDKAQVRGLTEAGFRLLVATADPLATAKSRRLAERLGYGKDTVNKAQQALRGQENVKLPLPLLEGLPFNPNRMRAEQYQRLKDRAASQLDQLTPIIACPQLELLTQPAPERYTPYLVSDGHHRCTAARDAGREYVWATLVPMSDELEPLERNIDLNAVRGEIDWLQLADLFEYLKDNHGLTNEQIANRFESLNMTESDVSRVRRFLTINVQRCKLQEALDAECLSRSHLYELSKLPTDVHRRAFETIVEKRLAARQAQTLVQKFKSGLTFDQAVGAVSPPGNDLSDGDKPASPAATFDFSASPASGNGSTDSSPTVNPDPNHPEPARSRGRSEASAGDDLDPVPEPEVPDAAEIPLDEFLAELRQRKQFLARDPEEHLSTGEDGTRYELHNLCFQHGPNGPLRDYALRIALRQGATAAAREDALTSETFINALSKLITDLQNAQRQLEWLQRKLAERDEDG